MENLQKTIEEVIRLLRESGYEPYSQLEGFVTTGNPSYITKHGGARDKILEIDREYLLRYLSSRN